MIEDLKVIYATEIARLGKLSAVRHLSANETRRLADLAKGLREVLSIPIAQKPNKEAEGQSLEQLREIARG